MPFGILPSLSIPTQLSEEVSHATDSHVSCGVDGRVALGCRFGFGRPAKSVLLRPMLRHHMLRTGLLPGALPSGALLPPGALLPSGMLRAGLLRSGELLRAGELLRSGEEYARSGACREIIAMQKSALSC